MNESINLNLIQIIVTIFTTVIATVLSSIVVKLLFKKQRNKNIEKAIVNIYSGDIKIGIKQLIKIEQKTSKNKEPSNYAKIKTAKGIGYRKLSTIEDPQTNLSLSINEFNEVIEIVDKKETPEEFAELNTLLGDSHKDLSSISKDLKEKKYNLDHAISAYIQSLNITKGNHRTDVLKLAETQEKLGVSYYNLSVITKSEDDLLNAINNFQEALAVREHRKQNNEFASIQNNLGVAYGLMAILKKDLNYCNEALHSLLDALEIRKDGLSAEELSATINNIGVIYYRMYSMNSDVKNLTESRRYLEDALGIRKEHNLNIEAAITANNLGGVYKDFSNNNEHGSEGLNDLKKAIEHYEWAYNIFSSENTSSWSVLPDTENLIINIANLLLDLSEKIFSNNNEREDYVVKSIKYLNTITEKQENLEHTSKFIKAKVGLGRAHIELYKISENNKEKHDLQIPINILKNVIKNIDPIESNFLYATANFFLGHCYLLILLRKNKKDLNKSADKVIYKLAESAYNVLYKALNAINENEYYDLYNEINNSIKKLKLSLHFENKLNDINDYSQFRKIISYSDSFFRFFKSKILKENHSINSKIGIFEIENCIEKPDFSIYEFWRDISKSHYRYLFRSLYRDEFGDLSISLSGYINIICSSIEYSNSFLPLELKINMLEIINNLKSISKIIKPNSEKKNSLIESNYLISYSIYRIYRAMALQDTINLEYIDNAIEYCVQAKSVLSSRKKIAITSLRLAELFYFKYCATNDLNYLKDAIKIMETIRFSLKGDIDFYYGESACYFRLYNLTHKKGDKLKALNSFEMATEIYSKQGYKHKKIYNWFSINLLRDNIRLLKKEQDLNQENDIG